MDIVDWKILQALEHEARLSYADLSERVGLSKSPCWNRVHDMEHRGLIEGYAAQLKPAALGLHVLSFVKVMIRIGAHAEFEAAIMNHPAIIECHTTAGSSDYMLQIFARSVEHLDDILRNDLSKLPGVDRLDSTICLKSIKRHGPLAQWACSLETVKK